MEELKEQLGHKAYKKLRELIKEKTSFSNLNKDNIEDIRRAKELMFTWLESIYSLNRKEIEMDEEGVDIQNLFKITER